MTATFQINSYPKSNVQSASWCSPNVPHFYIMHPPKAQAKNLRTLITSLCCVPLFVTPWATAHQASLSCTISQSLLKITSIESVTPSNYLILCHPLLLLPSIFPSIRVFPVSWLFISGSQSIGASASASVLPMNIQG